ncbi:MAG: hypothetical protein ACU84Q_05620 [Gammaproteobacteria bacterium]
MRKLFIVLCFYQLATASTLAAEVKSNQQPLVDELMVFIDKDKFARDLADYHKKLILPAVKRYYSATPLDGDPKLLEIATARIDAAVAHAVSDGQLIERSNRDYFLATLNENELQAIVEILKLPSGKKILLNFSSYLEDAKAIRVSKGRGLRNLIEQDIFDALNDYQNKNHLSGVQPK